MICTCDQCDLPFCALQLTALIKLDWGVLQVLYCFACLYHSLEVVQPSWIAVPCPTTKLSLLISKPFVGIKAWFVLLWKPFWKTSLGICIYKTSLLHRPNDYIGFTSSCPPTFYNKIAPMPGRELNEPFFVLKFCLETRLSSESLEPLIGFLAYLEPKLWLKNTLFDKNINFLRKVWFTLSWQILASHNSTADWARELFKPSKDSWSLLV